VVDGRAKKTIDVRNENDHEREARVHPASPILTVAVEAMERYNDCARRLEIRSKVP